MHWSLADAKLKLEETSPEIKVELWANIFMFQQIKESKLYLSVKRQEAFFSENLWISENHEHCPTLIDLLLLLLYQHNKA